MPVGKRTTPLGHWWLSHPERRQYDGLTFDPGKEKVIGHKLNLWQGWAIEPKQGDWSLMKQHILDVICDRDKAAYDYVIKWLAWMFQNPNKQAEVALVLKGDRGAGKGTLGNMVIKIFGQHAVHVRQKSQFIGRFNAHLRDCCFLFADEAYWAGDKEAEGSLQGLITEPCLPIEGKGRDLITVPNMLHVLIASNNDWVVPAGAFERRYVVLETSNHWIDDKEYFKGLYKEINNGGGAATLHDLLAMELGDWHPRQIYRTKALADQQRRSLSHEDAAWVQILEDGILPGAIFYDDNPNEALSNGLYTHMKETSPALKHHSDIHLANYLRERGSKEHPVRRIQMGKRKLKGWAFPSLSICRQVWSQQHPEWEFDDQTEWGEENEQKTEKKHG